MRERIKRIAAASLATILVWVGGAEIGAQDRVGDDAKPLVVFLARHAEKAKTPDDPELSKAGIERARLLAELLRDAKIDHVHTSDYRRTRDTASPIAKRLGINPQVYDPSDLPSLLKRLRATRGKHLVVGHSNTTPEMVKLLGADPGSPIVELSEYDRLYIVTVDNDNRAQSILLRYGEAAPSTD